MNTSHLSYEKQPQLCRITIAVCSEIHTRHVGSSRMLDLVVHIVTLPLCLYLYIYVYVCISTGCAVNVGPLPPLGSIYRRLCPYIFFCPNHLYLPFRISEHMVTIRNSKINCTTR